MNNKARLSSGTIFISPRGEEIFQATREKQTMKKGSSNVGTTT